jgi:3-phenylpropionate/trans-cinnamate dioxygenase ferredoxin reductase subunit
MSTRPTFVIVGAGLAGAKAAEALRAEGFDGRLLLFGEEAERPYERPPLSKAYLRGETDRDSLYVHPEAFYAANDIELRPSTRVDSIDPAARRLELATGERIGYGRLLLTTGATARRLRLPGADLGGVHHLRSRRDADSLAAAAARAEHVVVVGTGWIGSEAAASLRQLGRDVTMVGPDPAPLARVLGPEVAGVYRDLHADHGVRLLPETRVTGFRGTGRVEAVITDDGRTIDADLVLVGAGAVPRTGLAEAAGLPVRNGVLVNDGWRRSGRPASTPPATSPPPGTPATRPTCTSSTGPTPSTRAPPRPGTCSAPRSPTGGFPTSTPTSTTWAWSTRGWPSAGTGWWSAATWPPGSSSPSGSRTSGSSPA